jgi:hypothetical protein
MQRLMLVARIAGNRAHYHDLNAGSTRTKRFIKGRTGFAAGFLPKDTSATRFTKMPPSVAKTAAEPEVMRNVQARGPRAQWKADLTTRRRSFVVEHLQSRAESIENETAANRAKLLRGRAERQRLLTADISDVERLSLPSISSTIVADFPTPVARPELSEAVRARNHRKQAALQRNNHLDELLTLHHRASNYITTIAQLEARLQETFHESQADHVARSFANIDTINSKTSARVTEARIMDQVLGTAAEGLPGVLEVNRGIRTKSSDIG